jgi:superfamily II RNA helicase
MIMLIYVQDTARRIARVSKEAKLEIDEEEYVTSFKPNMMDVVHAWCSGASFFEICKMTDIFEGKMYELTFKHKLFVAIFFIVATGIMLALNISLNSSHM